MKKILFSLARAFGLPHFFLLFCGAKGSRVLRSAAILAALALCASQPSARAEPQEFPVGLLYPMSGPMAEIGEQRLMGTMLAVEQYNASSGDLRLKALLEDTAGDPRAAVASFQKLALKDGVQVVLTALSSVSMAVRPIAERSHVLVFANSAHPGLVQGTSYILRNFVTVQGAAERAAAFFEQSSHKSVAMLYLEDEFGESMRKSLQQASLRANFKIVAAQSFDKAAVDMKPQLLKLRAHRPDVVFIVGLGTNIGLAYRQAAETKLNSKLIGWFVCSQASVFESAKDFLNGTYSIDPLIDRKSPSYQRFAVLFRAKYPDKPIEPNSLLAFDAINILAEALRSGTRSPEAIRKYIVQQRWFQTSLGKVEFSPDGDSRRPMIIQKIEAGSCLEWDGRQVPAQTP